MTGKTGLTRVGLRARLLAGGMALALAGCGGGADLPDAPPSHDLRAALRDQAPVNPAPDACWTSDNTPAVIETVTEQIVVAPAEQDAQGNVLKPATFRSVTQQRMVQDRREVWFRTPCAPEWTVEFVATLQRALKARGLYTAPVTGEMDAATAEAVRRFQSDQGLESAKLSLAAARILGISEAPRQ